MDTPAQTNSALPQQGGDAGAVSDQSKTGEDYQNQQGSKQANQSTAKGSNDSKNTKNELYYTQTDGVTGRFDFDQNPAPLAAEPSCYKIARQSTKHMGIGTIALSDSGIAKTNAAIAAARALSQQLEHSASLEGLIPGQQYHSCADEDIKHVPRVYLRYKLVKTKPQQLSLGLPPKKWQVEVVKPNHVNNYRHPERLIEAPLDLVMCVNASLRSVQKNEPKLLLQQGPEADEKLFEYSQNFYVGPRQKSTVATPTRTKRPDRDGSYISLEPAQALSLGEGVGLAYGCCKIYDTAAYRKSALANAQPPKAQDSSQAPEKASNQQGNSSQPIAAESVQQPEPKLSWREQNDLQLLRLMLSRRCFIKIPKTYSKIVPALQTLAVAHGYHNDTNRAKTYTEGQISGALSHLKRQFNELSLPLAQPPKKLDSLSSERVIAQGIRLTVLYAQLTTKLPELDVLKKTKAKRKVDLSARQAALNEALSESSQFLVFLAQFYDSAVPVTELVTKTQEAQALCELWQSDLAHKAEYEMALDAVAAWQAKEAKKAACAQAKKDAEAKKQAKKAQPVVTQGTSTKDAPAQTADNASDTKDKPAPEPPKVPEYDPVQTALHQEQLLALLSQVKALAGTLPHDMSCLADSVTLIEQLMALMDQPAINGADLQQLALRCLEFTHALTLHQLIVLGAAGDNRLADARTALEFLRTQLRAWQQLRAPAHIRRVAQFLTQSLTTEADLVAIPYYEPQGQPFAPWVYGIGKALGKSERLVVRVNAWCNYLPQARSTSQMDAASK